MEFESNECHNLSKHDSVYEVVDVSRVASLANFDDEVDVFDMTSLNAFILLGQSFDKDLSERVDEEEDTHLQRLSLAYEKLQHIPSIILEEIAPRVKILDISHNEFDDFGFLCEFKELTSLICDHNHITSRTQIPYMPKLELLWLNHCKISELYPWSKRLQLACPNLRFLSLMGNSAAPSYLNGGNFYEYLQYRLFIISLFPNLVHLDDRNVNNQQREEALRMYKRPLLERLAVKTTVNLPAYLRQTSDKITEILAPTPQFAVPGKNLII